MAMYNERGSAGWLRHTCMISGEGCRFFWLSGNKQERISDDLENKEQGNTSFSD